MSVNSSLPAFRLKQYVALVLLTVFILLIQFISVVNIAFIPFVVAIVFYGFVKEKEYALIPILGLSFYHGEQSISLYTLKLSGVSVFYIVMIVLTMLVLFLRKKLTLASLNILLCFIAITAYSILLGNSIEFNYFALDVFFIVIALAFYISLHAYKKINYDLLFISLGAGYYLAKIISAITGIGLEVVSYTAFIEQKNALFDPVENFLIVYSIHASFYANMRLKRVLALFNVILFILAMISLGYIHGGTIVLVLASLLFCIIKRLKYVVYATLSISLLLGSVAISISLTEDSVLYYKVEKVIGLFKFVTEKDFTVYELPRSAQVRVIESANLLDRNVGESIFGSGFGGYIEETKFEYGSYLNEDDYSRDEIKSGKFYNLHTFNQLFLKHGLLGVAIILYLWSRRRFSDDKNIYDVSLIFLLFSYGYTIKSFLILGFFLYVCFEKSSNKRI